MTSDLMVAGSDADGPGSEADSAAAVNICGLTWTSEWKMSEILTEAGVSD